MFISKVKRDLIAQNQQPIIKVLIEKGMGAMKPNIKAKALESLLGLFEVSENFDEETIETLESMLKHKNVKVSAN